MNWFRKDCLKIEPLLLEYVEQELPGETKQRVSRHLEGCAACRQVVSGLKDGLEWAKQMRPASPPADFTTKVMARVAESRQPRPTWQWKQAFVVAGVAVILVTVWLFPRERTSESVLPGIKSPFQVKPQVMTPAPPAPAQAPEKPVIARVQPETSAPRPAAPRKRNLTIARIEPAKPTAPTADEATAAKDELSILDLEGIVVASNLQAGTLYEQNGRMSAALSAYGQAAQQGEQTPEALLAMGRVHEQMGELDAAMEAYAAALVGDVGSSAT